jgi:hypothetical protein
MGVFKKDELLLDFKGVQTEDISSTIPYMNKLNAEAKVLVSQLNPNSNYNSKGLVLFNESEQYDMYKLFEKSSNINNNDNNFSETSPFISSDVYNQLLTKINKQSGGAKSNSRDEDRDEDFEDDSSTSSDSSDSDKKNKKKLKKALQRKNSDDEVDLEPEEDEDELSEMSAGSYLSSSAHTNNDSDDSNNSIAKSYTSSVSAKNHHRRNLSESINTSDINIISVDD